MCDDLKRESIIISEKCRQMQQRMKAIYEKQKLAGGIIDENKNEIIILTVFFINLISLNKF